MTLCLPSPSLESFYQTFMPIFIRGILKIPGPLKIPDPIPKVPPGPPLNGPGQDGLGLDHLRSWVLHFTVVWS